ncbi:MAG: BREX system P-loop protein BrxC [Lachnospiraceae bacterium]|nr:BREX system P-loop protein BrxC [Lachnospiraceae bacterium]
MKIREMFLQEIDRPIAGVVMVGQNQEKDKKQELSEYVVTKEMTKHFREFFANYTASIQTPTDEIGVWISGFFGSGKSHFLKILSYILDDTLVAGMHANEYFKDKENLLSDPTIYANMELASHTPTQAILFNVDSKSASTAKTDSNAIVTVFNRVFNEKLGYDGANPALADLERQLDEEGKYQLFQDTFRSLYGQEWKSVRNKFRTIRGRVEKTLVEMGYMDEDNAKLWTRESTTQNYQIAIGDFAERVHQYIERSGNRVVFLVDEIGQFISTNSQLMLNLQTMTEELGTRCHGKAWIIVTAQEDIDSMTENIDRATERKNDFSKIQGRFKTRLSLTSVNADEVIRERILKKKDAPAMSLRAFYESEETVILNAVDFKDSGHEMKKYKSADEFADVYPFLPYQFHLVADILNAIRLNSSSGRHQSEGERSMLGAFQKAAIAVMEKSEGAIVPLNLFYNDLEQFIDHTHSVVILRAQENERVNPNHEADCFPINVLKVLFLLKYVPGIPLTENNIVNFMMTDIHEDKTVLRKKVSEALQLLVNNLLVSQAQDTYEFLTDEEQDINRQIRDRNVSERDVMGAIARMVFDGVYNNTRYRVPKFNGRYTFAYNQIVDNIPLKNNQNNQIGLRIITPRYVGNSGDGNADDTTLAMISARNQEAVLRLPADNVSYYREMRNALKIEDFIRGVPDTQKGKSTIIRSTKMQEAGKSKKAALDSLNEAIGNADIFVNGQHITDIKTHEAVGRINDALGRLVDTVYYKLSYINSPKDDIAIRNVFQRDQQIKLDLGEAGEENVLAIKEVQDYISRTTSSHTMISMKSLLDHFALNPYGYTEMDTKWLVAKLFKDGKISATVEKEPITIFNRDASDLGTYFTNRRYEEKILFKAKEMIDPAQVNDCRKIMKELFNRTETTEDADRMMAAFKNAANALISDLRGMLREQANEPDYPGKTIMQEVISELTRLEAITDEGTFFKTISRSKADLSDLAEDLAPVRTFFNSDTQKKFFKNFGLCALDYYDSSKEHITDETLTRIVDQIRSIVKNRSPYERIKDLPVLYDKFMESYNQVLDAKLIPVKQVIEQDLKIVLDALEGQSYKDRYESRVKKEFNDLLNRAENESNISDMLGFKDKADSLCRKYLDEFAAIPAPVTPGEGTGTGSDSGATPGAVGAAGSGSGHTAGGGGSTPAKPPVPRKKVKNVMARNLVADTWYIRNSADIDQYLDQLRKQIEAELTGNDEVRLHL